jgi:hypothetical protein
MNMSDMRWYWPEGIGVEKYMYIDPLARKGLEEGGLSVSSLTGGTEQNRRTSSNTELRSVEHHLSQHCDQPARSLTAL